MKAWHFLQDNGELQWPCGRVRKPEVGQILTVDPDKLELCQFGLHASTRIIDALKYAPGSLICRVEIGGKIIKGDDKLVASERTIIQMADATNTLHEMGCWAAGRALKRIKNPDPRSIAAIEAKRKWVRGEISDKELAAARAAARAAAWAAARAAAWAAARDAARAAAWDAARAAAWGAARASARAAAWGAARAAARAAAWGAARGAAWGAAWGAEERAQNRKLTRMVNELLESQ